MGTAAAVVAASFGDLVCGLAAVSPPAPFVGELGCPADVAAQSLVGGLLRCAGATVPTGPKVTINGRAVGTTAVVAAAIPASPTPGIARMPVGSGIARVGGEAITMHGAAAFLQPTSAISDLGGGQSVLRLHGMGASEPAQEIPSALDEVRKSIPRRLSFEPGSALHQLLSRCSAARQLDLAPAAYEVLVGDPVDVVTGAVVSDAVDFEQPWPALRFTRRYHSRRSDRASELGHGWSHALDQWLVLEPGRVVLRDGDGREREFDTLHLPGRVCRPGDVLHDPTQRFRLRCVGSQQWELHDDRHTVRQFAAVPGDPEPAGERARLSRVAPRDGVVIECAYAAGRLAEVRADGHPVLRLEHDERGLLRRLYSVTAHGELLEASYHYSSDDTLLRVIDPDGRERRYEYAGRLLVEETNRDGGRSYYGYDGVGAHARCVRAWGEGGRLDRAIEHDPTEGRTTVRDGLGQATIYRYDAAGLVTEITRAGLRHTYRYDEHLRLVEVGWPDGTRQTAAYDDAGQLVRRSERDGSTWTMAYDAHGRLAEGTDPAGGRWRFHHDERGRLRELQDPCGQPTRVDFDRGQCRVIDATGHGFVVGLDGQQRVTELPEAGGERLRYSYDPQGRLARAWAAGGREVRWSYDRRGRPIRLDGSATRVQWTRSGEGAIVEVEHDGRRARIERDPFGVIRAIEAAGRVTHYTHDAEGRLLTVREGQAPLLHLQRDPAGRVLAYEAPGVGRCELRRGPRDGRIVGLRQPGEELELQWDAADRLTRVQRGPDRVSTYAYRADGYLVEATNEHIACVFERDARGAVLQQRWGEIVVSDAFPDHRGRRSGLRLGDRVRVSYLRGPQGDIERIAVLAGPGREPLELRPEVGPHGQPPPLPELDPTTVDPLWRPVSPRGPGHLVWDEDRCLAVDDAVLVHHPEDEGPSFVIDGEGSVTTIADHSGGLAPLLTEPPALDRALTAAFPRVEPSFAAQPLPTPTARLHALLSHRAWTPEVRPVPGTVAWNPDEWAVRVPEPTPETGRLTAQALLQALGSPFPRPGLVILP